MRSAVLAALMLLAAVVPVRGATIVGGISFDDNAFVDEVVSYTDSWAIIGTAATIEDAVTGSDPTDGVFPFPNPGQATMVLAFTDNSLVNGPGDDLALFEYGNADDSVDVAVTVGGTAITYQALDTGYDVAISGGGGTYNLNVALINLDDFGIVSGGALDKIEITPLNLDAIFSLNVAGAINSGPPVTDDGGIPEPATLGLLALGVVGLAIRERLA
jgi:hypothetical protein